MGKKDFVNIKRAQAEELNRLFEEAAERGNYGMIDNIINDLAYGTDITMANPIQAFVLVKARARLFEPEDIEFHNSVCFMAELIGDNEVNPGNKALLSSLGSQDKGGDLLRLIADGNFKAVDENGSDFSIGFDEFEPQQATRIIRYTKEALAELRRAPPQSTYDDHVPG